MFNYIRELTRLPRAVRMFLSAEPLLGVGFGLYAFILNFYLLERHLTEAQVGELTSIHMLVMGLSAIPFGYLADRVSRKKVVVLGTYAVASSYFILALGEQYSIFLLSQIVNALGLSMIISAEIPLLYGYCRNRREETQTYNMMFAIFTLFTGLGTLLGGVAAGAPALYRNEIWLELICSWCSRARGCHRKTNAA